MFSASDTPIDLLLSRAREIDGVAVLSTALVVMGAYGVMFVAAAGSPFARAVLFKTGLFARALAHMALSREKSGWPKNRPDPAVALDVSSGDVVSVKRVIFVRHGESTWNEIFNRGFNFRFPLRLFEGLMSELLLLFTKSSFFVDSPLSDYGYEQARELRRFLRDYDGDAAGAAFDAARKSEGGKSTAGSDAFTAARRARRVADADALAGKKSTSIIVSSNLRRAVATTALGFWDRLARTGEKIYVLSCMQEIARNVDTCALAGARECPALHGIESKVEDINNTPMGRMIVGDSGSVVGLNTHFNVGNKPIGRVGFGGLLEFAEWCSAQDAECIIAGGHSLWFKEFFKAFLDRDASKKDLAARKKIVNCGVVGFTLTHVKHPRHGDVYRVDPESVDSVYGGFAR